MTTSATRTSTRERVVTAAVAMTAETGWSGVTMGAVADRVGVSRQTVHHEVGTKQGLAEAMVEHELARFLAVVAGAFEQHPDDVVAGLRDAAYGVLALARDNPLLVAVVSATQGADTELLPLLTTRSESLVAAARDVVGDRLAAYPLDLAPAHLAATVDMVVRLVLSHVMQPSGTPRDTADGIAWMAARLLRS